MQLLFQITESGSGNGNSSRRPVAYKKSVTSSRLPNISTYDDIEFTTNNNNFGEDREERRKKEVEDLISKYAKKKDKDEVRSTFEIVLSWKFLAFQMSLFPLNLWPMIIHVSSSRMEEAPTDSPCQATRTPVSACPPPT